MLGTYPEFPHFFFFFNDTATTEIYTLSLHDALPIDPPPDPRPGGSPARREGARHRQHASEGRSRSRLRPRGWGRGRAGPPCYHRRAGAGARGVAGRSRHHHHEGLSVNLHEYQARDILRRHGIPVPPGEVATTADEARAIAVRLGGGRVVVKAQVHA